MVAGFGKFVIKGRAMHKEARVTEIANLLKDKREQILHIASEHGANDVRIFGSVVRGESGPCSDIDMLVVLDPDRSLLDHVALKQDIEDLLGQDVDVVTENALHWYIRARILEEAVPL